MEEKGADQITAFDSLFTTGKIQMLKILFTRLPAPQQRGFAVYIKFLELQYTLEFLRCPPKPLISGKKPLSADFFSGDHGETIELLDELLPFSSPAERSRIEGIKSMLQNMARMKEMMEMMEMLKEMFPDGFGGDGESPMDLLSGMSGMSGIDLSAVFDMFGKEN